MDMDGEFFISEKLKSPKGPPQQRAAQTKQSPRRMKNVHCVAFWVCWLTLFFSFSRKRCFWLKTKLIRMEPQKEKSSHESVISISRPGREERWKTFWEN